MRVTEKAVRVTSENHPVTKLTLEDKKRRSRSGSVMILKSSNAMNEDEAEGLKRWRDRDSKKLMK